MPRKISRMQVVRSVDEASTLSNASRKLPKQARDLPTVLVGSAGFALPEAQGGLHVRELVGAEAK
jgi:hypothetical protein